ncbi:MAG: hypothetical protein IPL32_20575 [Chloracidobacterium sp.]|nr:hypothetical protein [Chloracidobacterium sp.]
MGSTEWDQEFNVSATGRTVSEAKPECANADGVTRLDQLYRGTRYRTGGWTMRRRLRE